jgi:fibronectin type 3 domain-containing protein
VTGYNIYRSTTSGGPYTLVGSAPASAFSFSDNAVASGTTYYYVVRAVAGVESINSNEATIPVL